jgi:Transglycosylase-like domain
VRALRQFRARRPFSVSDEGSSVRTVLPCLAALAAAAAVGLTVFAGNVSAGRQADAAVLGEIRAYRADTWHWQQVMGVPRTPYRDLSEFDPSLKYAEWVRALWQQRALQARVHALHPPHRSEFLCIHRFEGSWTANTGNGYYGGLQMDAVFQRLYGADLFRRKGTADHWTPLEQIWVAERAYRRGRGFYPWPNTARFCGLI